MNYGPSPLPYLLLLKAYWFYCLEEVLSRFLSSGSGLRIISLHLGALALTLSFLFGCLSSCYNFQRFRCSCQIVLKFILLMNIYATHTLLGFVLGFGCSALSTFALKIKAASSFWSGAYVYLFVNSISSTWVQIVS